VAQQLAQKLPQAICQASTRSCHGFCFRSRQRIQQAALKQEQASIFYYSIGALLFHCIARQLGIADSARVRVTIQSMIIYVLEAFLHMEAKTDDVGGCFLWMQS
jgi:hypothetical protein